jgi:ribonuclease D
MTLAIIRALWFARDDFARQIDIAPGRVFNDEALIELATKRPTKVEDFTKIVKRRSRVTNAPTTEWFSLLQSTLLLPESELPVVRTPSVGLPPIKLWKDRNPLGNARLSHARAAVIKRAGELDLPVENLISPEVIRQLTWKNPPESELELYIEETLASHGARPWQIAQIAPVLTEPLLATEPLVVPEPAAEEAPEAAEGE